ncbi:MAG TPA: hypothetical protein VHM23_19135 [Actinomycetota bacterium]|jgi:hypothetical protein|nr:hypothetical protein [Actinomycetota bacterium]
MRSPGWPSIARTRGARLGTLSVLLACGLLLAMVQPAAAKLVERSHDHIVETFEEDLCGIPVITTIDIIENLKVRLGKNGFPLFKTTGPGTFTSTNPATGKSVVETFSGATKDLSVVDNGDGTITVRTAITGVAQEVTLSDGTVAIKDVGRVVVATVLDYNGTPTDTSDDEFISQTIESISGPHPNLESNFTLFCEVVVPALT